MVKFYLDEIYSNYGTRGKLSDRGTYLTQRHKSLKFCCYICWQGEKNRGIPSQMGQVAFELQFLQPLKRGRGEKLTCQHRRHKRCGFSPWVGKIPWKRARQPTPVFLLGESNGEGSLAGCSPPGLKVGHD